MLKNKQKNMTFQLDWKEKYPDHIDILKVLLMIPLILKNTDYFEVENRNNIAYYDLKGFVSFSGEKYSIFLRYNENNSSFWVYYSDDEEPKRLISLKAVYGKCLFSYLYPVMLFYNLSNKNSKNIVDDNLIIYDEIKMSLQNYCVEKDKEHVETKKQKRTSTVLSYLPKFKI